MVQLIIPGQTAKNKKIEETLFVAQILELNDQGIAVGAAVFPMPEKGIQRGATLPQIKAHLDKPIDIILDKALQAGTIQVLLRVTEINRFREELIKAATQQSLRMQAGLKDKSGNNNDTIPPRNNNAPINNEENKDDGNDGTTSTIPK